MIEGGGQSEFIKRSTERSIPSYSGTTSFSRSVLRLASLFSRNAKVASDEQDHCIRIAMSAIHDKPSLPKVTPYTDEFSFSSINTTVGIRSEELNTQLGYPPSGTEDFEQVILSLPPSQKASLIWAAFEHNPGKSITVLRTEGFTANPVINDMDFLIGVVRGKLEGDVNELFQSIKRLNEKLKNTSKLTEINRISKKITHVDRLHREATKRLYHFDPREDLHALKNDINLELDMIEHVFTLKQFIDLGCHQGDEIESDVEQLISEITHLISTGRLDFSQGSLGQNEIQTFLSELEKNLEFDKMSDAEKNKIQVRVNEFSFSILSTFITQFEKVVQPELFKDMLLDTSI